MGGSASTARSEQSRTSPRASTPGASSASTVTCDPSTRTTRISLACESRSVPPSATSVSFGWYRTPRARPTNSSGTSPITCAEPALAGITRTASPSRRRSTLLPSIRTRRFATVPSTSHVCARAASVAARAHAIPTRTPAFIAGHRQRRTEAVPVAMRHACDARPFRAQNPGESAPCPSRNGCYAVRPNACDRSSSS
jgi:hypothetical protein